MRTINSEQDAAMEQERQRRERQQQLSDIKAILATPEGTRFYKRALDKCGTFRLSFTGNSKTFFNEGQRNIGNFLLAEMMEACPEKFVEIYNQGEEA
jgi:hypothetical protein